MPTNLILIRCMEADARVVEMHQFLAKAVPEFQIIAVPDYLRKNASFDDKAFADAGITALPLTDEWIRSAQLKKAELRPGWVCGDYAFYRSFGIEWDYAWVMEPDVYFLNGAEDVLSGLNQVEHDLISTRTRKENQSWAWYEPLRALNLGLEVHAMGFPLVRISRRLAEHAYELRKDISLKLSETQVMPNDESVIASLAHSGDFSILDLLPWMQNTFKFWGTMTRYNVDDIAANETEKRIVHSGRRAAEFDKYLQDQLKEAKMGREVSSGRILQCLEHASSGSRMRFIEAALKSL